MVYGIKPYCQKMSQNPMYDKMTERADGIFTSSSSSSTHPEKNIVH